MKAVVGYARIGDARERRCVDLAPIGGGLARTDIVHEDDKDVRRIGRQALRVNALLVNRVLHRQPGRGGRRRGRER
jgi:hypothetical protein